MSDNKEAAALVMRNIAMLEDVTKVYNEMVGPDFCEEVDRIISGWISDSEWAGESKLWDDDEMWFAPSSWQRLDKNKDYEESEDYDAYYSWTFVKDGKMHDEIDDFYWISPFLGVGQFQVGFCLNVKFTNLGYQKKNMWKKFLQEHDLSEKIRELGFIQLNDGTWFLPWKLDANLLADAYLSDTLVDALQPLALALEKIKEAHPLFEKVIEDGINNEKKG